MYKNGARISKNVEELIFDRKRSFFFIGIVVKVPDLLLLLDR